LTSLWRYNADGTLDESFGTHGRVTTDFANSSDAGEALVVRPDGKIIVVGSTSSTLGVIDFAVARYNADGALDSGFGSGGKVTTDFGAEDTARAVALQADSKIVVVGDTRNPVPTLVFDFALARYNADGALDSSFGSGGKVTTDFGGVDSSSSVAIQADGRIVALGSRFTTSSADFAIARYHTDGVLDSDLDADGKVTTDFGGGTDTGSSVVIQADGKILASGSSRASGGDSEFALARYRPDGTLDPSFSADGKVTTDLGGEDTASAVAIQSDGKIVVAGAKEVSSGLRDFAVARYLGDPVQSIVINDGAAQRSMVTRLTVAFSTVVTLDSGAFELIRHGGGPVSLTVASSVVGFQTVAVLTFSGPDIVGGSLADGKYTLSIHGDLIRDSQGHAIDADADGTAGGDRVLGFHRLFGDTDGDRDVDKVDQDVFRRTFHSQAGDAAYLWFLDFDGDGKVDSLDQREFNRRRNMVLNP
jgi:uncharacterized delta-60 repeat protein